MAGRIIDTAETVFTTLAKALENLRRLYMSHILVSSAAPRTNFPQLGEL
jgi:hypothetical protein